MFEHLKIGAKKVSGEQLRSILPLHYKYGVKNLYELSQSLGGDKARDSAFFCNLLNYNYIRNSHAAIDFVYSFLAGKLKDKEMQINEVICFNPYIEEESIHPHIPKYYGKTLQDAYVLIEDRIESVIDFILDFNEPSENGLIARLFEKKEYKQKMKFINENKNIYKNNLDQFISIKINKAIQDSEIVLIPDLKNVSENLNFTSYAMKDDEIITLHQNIKEVYLITNGNMKYLDFYYSNSENKECRIYFATSENCYLTYEPISFDKEDLKIHLSYEIEKVMKSISQLEIKLKQINVVMEKVEIM